MAGSSPTEEIKARLDIVEFIRSYVRLEKAGVNFKAACPFHAEKTPSFFVSPARQTWHCFGGCGEGGDIFSFVMKVEGLDFPEALRLLALRAGVELKREDPRLRSERNRLYDLCEAAADVFHRSLLKASEPKEYLKTRGLAEDTARSFRIGFAPDGWDFILRALASKGFKPEEIEKAGLAVYSPEQRSRHDRFRSRIMFPVADANGRVVGFGGRIFYPAAEVASAHWRGTGGTSSTGSVHSTSDNIGSGTAKYINTPQTAIYDKSRVLYGFDKAKQEIRTKNRAVAVEGYMDCVMSHQAGVRHAIAVSGTALTHQHLTVLRRLCDTLVSSFDADAAGESATRRSLTLAAQFDFARLIAAIPLGKDPADTARDDPAAWRDAVASARPVMDFYFDKTLGEADPASADGKKKISSVLLPLISELNNEIEKAHWVSLLSLRLGVAEDAIWKDLRRASGVAADASALSGAPAPESAGSKESVRSRRSLLESRLIALFTVLPEDARIRQIGSSAPLFSSDLHRRIFDELADSADVRGDVPPDIRAHMEAARFQGEVIRERSSDIEAEFMLCGRELEKVALKERLRSIGEQIREKERARDSGALPALLEHFRSLSEQLKIIA